MPGLKPVCSLQDLKPVRTGLVGAHGGLVLACPEEKEDNRSGTAETKEDAERYRGEGGSPD